MDMYALFAVHEPCREGRDRGQDPLRAGVGGKPEHLDWELAPSGHLRGWVAWWPGTGARDGVGLLIMLAREGAKWCLQPTSRCNRP
jgi:hypothetical protein